MRQDEDKPETSCMKRRTHLVNSQVNASIGDDAQHVGDVAFIESSHALLQEDVLGTIHHPSILTGLSQSQSCLQDLRVANVGC